MGTSGSRGEWGLLLLGPLLIKKKVMVASSTSFGIPIIKKLLKKITPLKMTD